MILYRIYLIVANTAMKSQKSLSGNDGSSFAKNSEIINYLKP